MLKDTKEILAAILSCQVNWWAVPTPTHHTTATDRIDAIVYKQNVFVHSDSTIYKKHRFEHQPFHSINNKYFDQTKLCKHKGVHL